MYGFEYTVRYKNGDINHFRDVGVLFRADYLYITKTYYKDKITKIKLKIDANLIESVGGGPIDFQPKNQSNYLIPEELVYGNPLFKQITKNNVYKPIECKTSKKEKYWCLDPSKHSSVFDL